MGPLTQGDIIQQISPGRDFENSASNVADTAAIGSAGAVLPILTVSDSWFQEFMKISSGPPWTETLFLIVSRTEARFLLVQTQPSESGRISA